MLFFTKRACLRYKSFCLDVRFFRHYDFSTHGWSSQYCPTEMGLLWFQTKFIALQLNIEFMSELDWRCVQLQRCRRKRSLKISTSIYKVISCSQSVTGVNQSIQTQLSSEDHAALLPRQTLFPKRIRAVELLKSVLHASNAALSDSMSFEPEESVCCPPGFGTVCAEKHPSICHQHLTSGNSVRQSVNTVRHTVIV